MHWNIKQAPVDGDIEVLWRFAWFPRKVGRVSYTGYYLNSDSAWVWLEDYASGRIYRSYRGWSERINVIDGHFSLLEAFFKQRVRLEKEGEKVRVAEYIARKMGLPVIEGYVRF